MPHATRRRAAVLALLAALGTASSASSASHAAVAWPPPRTAPAVRAASADGATFAVSGPVDERGRASTVRLLDASGAETGAAELPGALLALQFDPAATRVFALVERPARRGAGDRELHAVDLPALETRRLMRVPRGTADLDVWTQENALLLALPDQVRTVLLDGLRSGPLFAIPGPNRALASLGGGSLVLAGQDDALLLVDLADPPGRDAMPVLERWDAPAPVVSIVAERDASGARVELADGSRRRVVLQPFEVRDDRDGAAPVDAPFATVRTPAYRKPAPPAAAPAVTAPVIAEIVEPAPEDAARPERTPPAASPPAPPSPPPRSAATEGPGEPGARRADDPVETSGAPETPGTAGMPEPVEDAGAAETVEPGRPPRPAEDLPADLPPAARGGLAGRVVGPAADLAAAVLLLGPDSILREAARVPVAADGTWRAAGLAPGRYKVQVDGGGGRVLVCDPPFRMVEIVEGEPTPSISFRALRAL